MKSKGISPVIGVLLLIIIAVALAVLTYFWVFGYMGQLQAASSPTALQEKIRIEAVEYRPSFSTLAIWVRNIGDVRVRIYGAYLIDHTGTVIRYRTDWYHDLDPGEVYEYWLKPVNSSDLRDGETYLVKIITTKGTVATYTFTWRG